MYYPRSANRFIMRKDIQYLGIGLFIGICATALFLTGMLLPPTVAATLKTGTNTPSTSPSPSPNTPQPFHTNSPPAQTFTPTPTLIRPTSTATFTETATITPTAPSPTPTLSDVILGLFESGNLSLAGPLSMEQQIQVYEASLEYIRPTTEGSRLLGEQINGKGYGAPSDICGPLSIAILQNADLINADLDPHRFWLLNPDILDDHRLLAKTFPSSQFENKRYKIKINKVDWTEIPLYPGDFVYIYAGTGGNFEHMLVVNRVDSEGRTYAVTNHKTLDGFIISEVLLYDPSNPSEGIFSTWTARPNAEPGSTGFAGFELWRFRSP